MENLELKPFEVSQDDLDDACDFVTEFCEELEEHKGRLTGTAEETATARLIRDRLHNETNARVRLEAYKARPIEGRGSLSLLGVWYALCIALYFLSFVKHDISAVILTIFSLVLFLAGSVAIMMLFVGKGGKLAKLLPKKVSYNVVSERCPSCCEASKERTVIICTNHDAVLGNALYDFARLRKSALIVVPISMVLFIASCIVKAVLAEQITHIATITTLTIVPFLSAVAGIAVLITHFSLSKKHARDRGGVATSVALATYAYFVENPHLLPNDVRIVFASFGGENSAHGGSRAFVKAHTEFGNAKVLAISDILDNNFAIYTGDHFLKIKHSQQVLDAISMSAREREVVLKTYENASLINKLSCLHGSISNAFAEANIHSATITAKHREAIEGIVRRDDVAKLFALSVTAVNHLMEE
ncbi:MAG: hypothetical protein J6Q06_04790 [Clostridia bacterium]|nr:hypothetical protein [Clostridia bacterium]